MFVAVGCRSGQKHDMFTGMGRLTKLKYFKTYIAVGIGIGVESGSGMEMRNVPAVGGVRIKIL